MLCGRGRRVFQRDRSANTPRTHPHTEPRHALLIDGQDPHQANNRTALIINCGLSARLWLGGHGSVVYGRVCIRNLGNERDVNITIS